MPRTRLIIASAATLFVVGPLVWFWQASLMPETYSIMDMGTLETGGPVAGPHAGHAGRGRGVESLTADPNRPADVSVTVTARKERFRLASGREVDGYTLNGESPGPTIHATAGQLVQVRLVNESVPDGMTLHWHGLDVPGAMDGVAGVTQDAVGIGEEFVYRFVADQVGTFWYHSHQVSHEQVRGGLLGALVVSPAHSVAGVVDVVALSHLYGGVRTVNGVEKDVRVEVPPGRTARVRVVNSDNGPMSAWVAGAPFKVVAVDGVDVTGPTRVQDTSVLITAGGRADLEITMDRAPVRVHVGGPTGVVLGSGSYDAPSASRPGRTLDLLSYGTKVALPFDPEQADRRFEYTIAGRPGFIDGKPGLYWTVNGRMVPDIPMFMVAEGDVVRVSVANRTGEVHPMHLHGHHVLVLSRDGVPATGSPWWVDSLNVGGGESYEIAFVADNPGLWMLHCHMVEHDAHGMDMMVIYPNISTPYTIGPTSGNNPF